MSIRFGKVTVRPLVVNKQWGITVTGKRDIEKHQALLNRHGIKQEGKRPSYRLVLTAIVDPKADAQQPPNPFRIKVGFADPTFEEASQIARLIDDAQPDDKYYKAHSLPKVLFPIDMDTIRMGLLNRSLKELQSRLKVDNLSQVLNQVIDLVKKNPH